MIKLVKGAYAVIHAIGTFLGETIAKIQIFIEKTANSISNFAKSVKETFGEILNHTVMKFLMNPADTAFKLGKKITDEVSGFFNAKPGLKLVEGGSPNSGRSRPRGPTKANGITIVDTNSPENRISRSSGMSNSFTDNSTINLNVTTTKDVDPRGLLREVEREKRKQGRRRMMDAG